MDFGAEPNYLSWKQTNNPKIVGPRAPQGPSDAELCYVPPDPVLPPFGGSQSLLMDLVAGTSMLTDRATSIATVQLRQQR